MGVRVAVGGGIGVLVGVGAVVGVKVGAGVLVGLGDGVLVDVGAAAIFNDKLLTALKISSEVFFAVLGE